MKKNYIRCVDEINKYFRQKYLGINDVALYDYNYNYILINFISFDGYIDSEKLENARLLTKVIDYFLEHINDLVLLNNIDEKRIIYFVEGIHKILQMKELPDKKYNVRINNTLSFMNKDEIRDYILKLPKLS